MSKRKIKWGCTWRRQVPLVAAFLVALNQAWTDPGQSSNALGAPPSKAVAETSCSPDETKNSSPTTIENVGVSRKDRQAEVRVEGKGALSYRMFRLGDPDRLVLDFSDALVRMARKSIPSDVQPVRAVRIGQHKADVARVVIDLASEVPYTIREDGNAVTVVFGSAAEVDPVVASKKQLLEDAFPTNFAPRPLPDLKSSGLSPDSLTQPAGAQDSPAAARTGPSGSVSAEPRPDRAQPRQQPASAPESKRASTAVKADPKEHSAQPVPNDLRLADLPESNAKPATVLGTPMAARSETSASASAEPRLGGSHAIQPVAPDPIAKEESKEARAAVWTTPGEDYVIGIDDVLAIHVWKEPEISRAVSVRPDGKISLPLIGELKASGLTPRALQTEVAARLSSYLFEPEVTVIVQEIRSQRFNIVGEISRPGTYPLLKPMTVLDAIALAGGFRDFAKITKIYVLRLRPDGSRMRSLFNYKDVIKGDKFYQNLELEPHDTIVVP